MAGRGGGFGGGRGGVGRPWGGEGPVVITLPEPQPSNSPIITASPVPSTQSTVAQDPPHTTPEPAPTTKLPPSPSPSPSQPPVSVPAPGATSTSSSPGPTDTPSHEPSGYTQTSGAASAQEAEGSASISVSFTIVDGKTIRFVTTVTTPSEATAVTAANGPRSSSRGAIVAVATLSALLFAAFAVALGIFLLRRRRRLARTVQSSFMHGSADSHSDIAPAIRAFSKEPRISRPPPVSNRESNVLDEENARLREAVARLQDQLEDLGHTDDPSLPAYDSHSAASIHSYELPHLRIPREP